MVGRGVVGLEAPSDSQAFPESSRNRTALMFFPDYSHLFPDRTRNLAEIPPRDRDCRGNRWQRSPSATFRHRDVRRPPAGWAPTAGERGNQRSLAAVDVCAVVDREDRHGGAVVIDAIQHAVRAAAGAEHAG